MKNTTRYCFQYSKHLRYSLGVRFIAIIPAKGTSTAIESKNLQKLGDASLLDWSLKFAIEQQALTRIIVSTESESIIISSLLLKDSIARFQVADVNSLIEVNERLFIHKRDAIQASSIAKTTDLLVEVFRNNSFLDEDIVVTLQPTTPFRSNEEFGEMIGVFKQSLAPHSLFTAVTFDSPHPGKAIILDPLGKIDISRTRLDNLDTPRQELETFFVSDGHYYFTRVSQIRDEGKLISKDSKVWIRYPRYQVNIDNIADLDFARFIFEAKRHELPWTP